MRHLKKYPRLNENRNNVSCAEYLEYAIDITLGNPQNFRDLQDIANTFDVYYEGNSAPGPGEAGYYTKETLTKFKDLVDQMLIDERKNYPPDYDPYENDDDGKDTRHQISYEEWENSNKYNL